MSMVIRFVFSLGTFGHFKISINSGEKLDFFLYFAFQPVLSRSLSLIIYWLLCFEQVYNQLINLPNKGIFGGRFISFAPLVIDRCIS